jgi:hypothetical protein
MKGYVSAYIFWKYKAYFTSCHLLIYTARSLLPLSSSHPSSLQKVEGVESRARTKGTIVMDGNQRIHTKVCGVPSPTRWDLALEGKSGWMASDGGR